MSSPPPIRAILVDDEKPARKRLIDLLNREPDVEVVAVCTGGADAVEAIHAREPDLALLDIQMPEVDGFGVLEAVGVDRMPVTIFVTAYQQYALRAFDAHAIDYLLKPFSDERFEVALRRARRYIRSGDPDALVLHRLQALLDDVRETTTPVPVAPPYLDRLVLKTRGRVSFLKVEEIVWVEAAGVYVKLHTREAVHLHREVLGRLEARLDPQQFVRIHRSALVNLEHIEELLPDSHGEYTVVLRDGTMLKLSRTYRPKLQARLGQSL